MDLTTRGVSVAAAILSLRFTHIPSFVAGASSPRASFYFLACPLRVLSSSFILFSPLSLSLSLVLKDLLRVSVVEGRGVVASGTEGRFFLPSFLPFGITLE